MANYFTAYRIDHILGFFRIWELPEHAMTGLVGKFRPSIPLSQVKLCLPNQKGFFTWRINECIALSLLKEAIVFNVIFVNLHNLMLLL